MTPTYTTTSISMTATNQLEDIEALKEHLDEFPDDWDSMLVIADAYEEQDDTWMAFAHRWCAENEKHPQKVAGDWLWWDDENWPNGEPVTHTLPQQVRWFGPFDFVDYSRRDDAMRALGNMFSQIEPGFEPGHTCLRNGCLGGIIEGDPPWDGCCCCHVGKCAPCSYCMTPREECDRCGWSAQFE